MRNKKIQKRCQPSVRHRLSHQLIRPPCQRVSLVVTVQKSIDRIIIALIPQCNQIACINRKGIFERYIQPDSQDPPLQQVAPACEYREGSNKFTKHISSKHNNTAGRVPSVMAPAPRAPRLSLRFPSKWVNSSAVPAEASQRISPTKRSSTPPNRPKASSDSYIDVNATP